MPAPTAVDSGPSAVEPSTKQRLLACAVDLMATHGSLDSVSLRAVAGAAGVSPTAVYRHFADRDELVEAGIEWAWAEFDRAIEAAGEDATSPHERLRLQGHGYVDVALLRPGVYTVLFGHRGVESAYEVGMPVFQKMADLVGDVLRANGDARHAVTVAVQLFTSIHGIAHLRVVQPTFPWPPVDDQIELLLSQIGLHRH